MPYKAKNEKGITPIIIILIVLIVLAAGGMGYVVYRGSNKTSTNQIQEVQQEKITESGKQTPSEIFVQTKPIEAKESLEDVLMKMKHIGPVAYERRSFLSTFAVPQASTNNIPDMTSKIWEESPQFFRVDTEWTAFGGKKVVDKGIVRDGIWYTFKADEDKWYKWFKGFSATIVTSPSTRALALLVDEISKDKTAKITGTEILDGKQTTVIEYARDENHAAMVQKVWVWNEKWVPLRIEMRSQVSGMGNQLSIIENRDFIFGDIPDNIFSIPPDKIIDINSL